MLVTKIFHLGQNLDDPIVYENQESEPSLTILNNRILVGNLPDQHIHKLEEGRELIKTSYRDWTIQSCTRCGIDVSWDRLLEPEDDPYESMMIEILARFPVRTFSLCNNQEIIYGGSCTVNDWDEGLAIVHQHVSYWSHWMGMLTLRPEVVSGEFKKAVLHNTSNARNIEHHELLDSVVHLIQEIKCNKN